MIIGGSYIKDKDTGEVALVERTQTVSEAKKEKQAKQTRQTKRLARKTASVKPSNQAGEKA